MSCLPCDGGGNEELRTIGIFASVCHAQDTGLAVLQLEVLIFELVSVDGFASSAYASLSPAIKAIDVDDSPSPLVKSPP